MNSNENSKPIHEMTVAERFRLMFHGPMIKKDDGKENPYKKDGPLLRREEPKETFVDVFSDTLFQAMEKPSVQTESAFHESISKALDRIGFGFFHEVKLKADKGRIDFLASFSDSETIGIEVKLRPHSSLEVVRQLIRYSEAEEIQGLLLVSIKPYSFVQEMHGKPVRNLPLYAKLL